MDKKLNAVIVLLVIIAGLMVVNMFWGKLSGQESYARMSAGDERAISPAESH